MSDNTLLARSNTQTIDETWFNSIRTALSETFVGRDTDGIPTAGKDLGSALYPWGKVYASDLVIDGSLVDLSTALAGASHKVLSGNKGSDSNQAMFLYPAGSGGGRILTISTSPEELIYEIAGESKTIFSSDITLSGLTAAPSTNNTATIATSACDNSIVRSSKVGERLGHDDNEDFTLTMSSVGSNISALVGKIACFKYVGAITQYFTAYVASSTTLTDIRRGIFFDSASAPFKRGVMNNGGTLTLMKLGWVFLDIDGTTAEAIYNEPTYSAAEPSSPASSDYWFDLTNSVWKRYNGSIYVEVDRLLVGIFFCDTSDCLGARSVDFYASHKQDNNVAIEYKSSTQIITTQKNQKICVFGNTFDFGETRPIWDITTDLAAASLQESSSTEGASRYYFAYITDEGDKKLADTAPVWRGEFFGWYHPFAPWRCVGYIYNNASSNFDLTYNASYGEMPVKEYGALSKLNFRSLSIPRNRLEEVRYSYDDGSNQNTTGATFVQVAEVLHNTVTGNIFICIFPTGYDTVNPGQWSTSSSSAAYLVLRRGGVKIGLWKISTAGGGISVPINFFFIEQGLTKGTTYTYDWGIESPSGATVQATLNHRAACFDITT